jgi:outer membrane protein assembly factor BamE (lipoprotein component of BamABCDE complex)
VASCGSICLAPKRRERGDLLTSHPVLIRALIGAVLVAFLSGCYTIPFGSPPNQARLAQLRQGLSTPADVLLLLGEPRGDGAVRWTPSLAPQSVWYYEYVVLGSQRIDNKALLVFFDQDRYVGYLWFSSTNLVKE